MLQCTRLRHWCQRTAVLDDSPTHKPVVPAGKRSSQYETGRQPRRPHSLVKDYIRLTESAGPQRANRPVRMSGVFCTRLDYMQPAFRASLVESRMDTRSWLKQI
jgi:hypothetical protein